MSATSTPTKPRGRRPEYDPVAAPSTDHWDNDSIELGKIKQISKLNRRRLTKADEPTLNSLAESIRHNGVLEPVLVRWITFSRRDQFELLAGVRRFEAAKRAKRTTIPVRILTVDDDAIAKAAIAIENLQREQLSPLEEAEAVHGLIDADHSIESAAICLGQSPHWVAGRARLSQLAPSWRKAMTDPDHPASHWSVAHLVEVAKLPTGMQDGLCKRVEQRWQRDNYIAMTVGALRKSIASSYLLSLKAARWKLDDPKILPTAGPCTSCPKRTGAAPLLWPDLVDAKSDQCTDEPCYRAKESALVQIEAAKIKSKTGKEPIKLVDDVWDYNNARGKQADQKVVGAYDVKPAKPTDPGAQPAIYVDGSKTGKTVWVAPKPKEIYDHQTRQMREQPVGPKSLATKRKELDRRRKALAVEKVRSALDEEAFDDGKLTSGDLLKLAVIFGTDVCNDRLHYPDPRGLWKQFDTLGAESEPRLWENVRAVFHKRLTLNGPLGTTDTADIAWHDCERLCGLLGLKSQHFLDEAKSEIKEPKSWAAEVVGKKKR